MADDNVVPLWGASAGPVPRTDEEIAADLLREYIAAPEEIRRFVRRYKNLHRLQELTAPSVIVSNQKNLVRRAISDLHELLETIRDDL